MFIGAGVLAAIIAPWLTPHDPAAGDLARRLQPPTWTGPHPFGTDHQGRDILSRLLYGARISLLVGLGGTAIGASLGTTLGLLAGFYRGWFDEAVMRVADIQLSFPFLALAVAVVAVVGTGAGPVIAVLGTFSWVWYARVVRAEVLSLREREFVEAARALGATDLRILLFHIWPNTVSPVVVLASFTFAQIVISEASLSFLGLGIQPPNPSWGGMLADARGYLQVAWWPAVFPAGAIFTLVLGANLLGDWLRDRLDPHWRHLGA